MSQDSLDPEDWPAFRALSHQMLDRALDKLASAREGRVWTAVPEENKQALKVELPEQGIGTRAAVDFVTDKVLPYGVGNTHPRFFGWVHGSGAPGGILADIAAGAMNANLGGRDHGAIYVEKQVVDWMRQMFSFPQSASGLVVSGTSIATVIALKVARDRASDFASRKTGVADHRLVGYTSAQAHSCIARAFDILGLGTDGLRLVPVNDAFEMDVEALQEMVAADRAAGAVPFFVAGTAGTVNVGSIDDLARIADIAGQEGMWFHVDGALGAPGILSPEIAPRLSGLRRADSLAFDFHKWLHVNYDAGFVLIRDGVAHRAAFSTRPDYLKGTRAGLAAGNPWPTEYGPELSRGFRALKIWFQLAEHGTEKLGALITQNCRQAQHLAGLVAGSPKLESLAPVAMNICCFRYTCPIAPAALDALNEAIVIALQEQGIAAPSTTRLRGCTAIRVNITNHRTQAADIDLLVKHVMRIGDDLSQQLPS